MYPAFIPCSATSQNWLPIRPSPTGVRRGFPVFQPFVSSNAYPGSGTPITSASLMGGLEKIFLERVNDLMLHFLFNGRARAILSILADLLSA